MSSISSNITNNTNLTNTEKTTNNNSSSSSSSAGATSSSSGSVFNISYDAEKSFGDNILSMADSLASTAMDSAISGLSGLIMEALAGGGKAAMATAGKDTAAQAAKQSAAQAKIMAFQAQAINTTLNTLVNLAQTGEIDLTEFQNMLTNQIVTTLMDNNTKAEEMNTQKADLMVQNEEIMAQIEALNKESGVDLVYDAPATDENGVESSSSTIQAVPETHKNAAEINKLISDFNTNLGLINGFTTGVSDLNTQSQAVAESGQQQLTEGITQKTAEIQLNLQSGTQASFDGSVSSMTDVLVNGIQEQVLQAVNGAINGSVNTSAAAAKTAEATAEGAASVVTFGATASLATAAGIDAGLFTAAAGLDFSREGLAKTAQTVLKKAATDGIQKVATNLSTAVNDQTGIISSLGSSLSSSVDFSSYLTPDSDGGSEEPSKDDSKQA